MRFVPGRRFLGALAFSLALLSLLAASGGAAAADPAKKGKPVKPAKGDIGKNIHFKTADGVELQGTYYPYTGPKSKDAVVLLLHDVAKGNGRNTVEWETLAEKLHEAGYAVLSFDFRGFGESTSVTEKFWDFKANKHNMLLRARSRGGKMPETINQTSFPSVYYPYLVNDIAAAKSYLDRRNDARELNSSSVIVIGAGQGATLGAMWMASDWHRRRATAISMVGVPTLDDPEGKDQACAVWLTISPVLGRRAPIMVPLRQLLTEVGGKNKVPMAFFYGSQDMAGKAAATNYLKAIDVKRNKLTLTGPYGKIKTKLTSSKLLQKDLGVDKLIINDYLKNVMEARGVREWKNRKADEEVYFWVVGTKNILCKKPREENPRALTTDDDLFRYLTGRR